MPTLQIDGETVGYDTAGSPAGIPLLVIHGTTMDRVAWDPVLAQLSDLDAYRVIKIDLPGAGESVPPAGPLTVEGIVTNCVGLLDQLGVQRVHVAGYSLGAVLATALAGTAPERVATATSLCGWVAADPRMVFTFDLWGRLIETDPALFIRYAFADGYSPATITALAPMIDDAIALGTAALAPGSLLHLELDRTLDIGDLLGSITAPLLVLGASGDRWVDVAHSRDLAERVPSAKLEILDGGHLVIQERAAEIAGLIETWVRQ